MDPGGETKYGISKRAHPNEDIKNLTLERAKEIYFHEYWLPFAAEYDWPINMCVFDCAVHGGIKNVLQRWKGVGGYKGFCEARIARFSDLVSRNPDLEKFKKGWIKRVNNLKKQIEIIESHE